MANLKEIRGRLASVKGTLKITSAMRLISSAKLHTAMNAVGAMVPYQKSLQDITAKLMMASSVGDVLKQFSAPRESGRRAVILVSSNQTLCGSFNANIIKTFLSCGYSKEDTDVYAVGKNGIKALRREGYSVTDMCKMAEKPDYDASAALAERLVKAFLEGKVSEVNLVYTHMVSRAKQTPVVETYLPFAPSNEAVDGQDPDYIIEPSPEEILSTLLPQVLRMKLHTMLLDAAAAEHAARTLAMQVASDNAQDLIGELSLQYNKLRQQAITNEILDLIGGQTK